MKIKILFIFYFLVQSYLAVSQDTLVIDGGIKEDYTTTLTSAPTAADAPNKPAIVKNAKGEVYQIDASGNVTKVGQYGIGYTNIEKQPINAIAGVKFSFKPNKAAKYPYDAFQKEYKKAAFRTHYLRMDTTYCDAKPPLSVEFRRALRICNKK